MILDEILSDFYQILETTIKAETALEDWYYEHERKKRDNKDERLGRLSKEQLKFYKQDSKIHPECYDLVSMADIKAARKRLKKKYR